MSEFELAQINIAQMQAPLESPQMADFVANLDRINALAETSPGFIWRLKTDDGDATGLRPFGDDLLVNMSVWQDVESLQAFVYQSAHVEIMRRRKEWFERMRGFMVLWWVPQGHRPSVAEAKFKLDALRQSGPTPAAFTFAKAYPPPGKGRQPTGFASECPAN